MNLDKLVEYLKSLARQIRGLPVVRWATVTSVSPLRIRIDGETDPLAGTPDTIIAIELLEVGDRVEVVRQNNRDIVQGKGGGFMGGGDPGPPGPPNTLTIGSVTTSAPGSSAEATITGTAPNQTLNLTLPRGEEGPPSSSRICKVSKKTTGSQTATTSEVTISGLSADFVLADSTEIKLSLQFNGYSSVAGDVMILRVKDGGTTIAVWTVPANSSGAATSLTHCLSRTEEFSAGSHSLTVTFVRVAGTGTITSNPTNLSPAELRAEELVLT